MLLLVDTIINSSISRINHFFLLELLKVIYLIPNDNVDIYFPNFDKETIKDNFR
jgi:hypothetical protein